MSSIPSRAAHHIDHETSYASYTNRGQHASEQGVISNYTTYYQYTNPLEELDNHCSHGAAVDSAARFDAPRCAESTRLGIIQTMEEWINSDSLMEPSRPAPSSLFWLHGGAGAGKSALAQSLSEKLQDKAQLLASFFFFRNDSSRNNGDHLIPTLVSQLIETFEGIRPFVEHRIHKNRALFSKNYQIQIQELLVGPLHILKSKKGLVRTHPRLIVIDGLDECEGPDVQCQLLRVIARAIRAIPYPLRFLVTSRPEAHITHVFNHDPDVQAITVLRYDLSNDAEADMDILKFLEKEFAEIRRVHRLGHHLPHDWPDRKAIASLVERSSRHFIYASTVIRYIRSPKHRPDDRLEVILRLRPPQEGDQPYAQLDALYALIFLGIETRSQLEKICLVLGILYFQSQLVGLLAKWDISIEGLLQMKPGDLILLLDPILSLVALDGGKVRILHKSLIDYLLDVTRGGHLPFDLARVHESAATYILKEMILRNVCDMYHFRLFAYHCQYAHLNETLKGYLRSLEVLCPKSVMTPAETFPSWLNEVNGFLHKLIWYFFRTLTREDFDPTGQVYEQYAVKWMSSLHSDFLIARPIQSTKVDKLDKLFTQWKPQHFPIDVETDRVVTRVASIKQVHRLFSAHAKASFSGTTEQASSLVFCDHFIHGYNVDGLILSLQTYSRHGNTCYQEVRVGGHDIVREIRYYLLRVEKYLFSRLYQEYGIEPDE